MSNSIMVGLMALAKIGVITSDYRYDDQLVNYQMIADYIGEKVEYNDYGYYVTNTLYCEDLYTFSGENRYYDLEWENGFLIFDKKNQKITELSMCSNSPYYEYIESFKIYDEASYDKYCAYYDYDFINVLTGKKVLSSQITRTQEKNPKDYYIKRLPGDDAHLVSNSFYFTKLGTMHADNYQDTCSLVATEVILGYYDTFLTDKMVDEKYDIISDEKIDSDDIMLFEQSPGVDSIDYGFNRFHDYLIGLSRDICGIEPVGGMTPEETVNVIKAYLNRKNINYELNYSEGNFIDTLMQTAISLIKSAIDAGRPLIVGTKEHSTVAYGYDNDYVYVVTGWGYAAAASWDIFRADLSNLYDVSAIDIKFTNLVEHCHSNNYYSLSTNNYICPCGMLFKEKRINPSEYHFEEQYYFYNKSQKIMYDDLMIDTNRLRTGFIKDRTINLSPKRQGAGEAYLEYKFDKPIERVSFDLAFWSTSEGVSSSDSSAVFQYKNSSGEWVTYLDLLNEAHLPFDRYNPKNYIFIFDTDDVYEIRFISKSTAVGTRNKGRICIGEMEVLYFV